MSESAGFLAGLAMVIFVSGMVYIMYRWLRPLYVMMDSDASVDEKINLFRELELEKLAKDKGIDLDAEMMKRSIRQSLFNKKNLKTELEKRMLEEYFPKKEGSDE